MSSILLGVATILPVTIGTCTGSSLTSLARAYTAESRNIRVPGNRLIQIYMESIGAISRRGRLSSTLLVSRQRIIYRRKKWLTGGVLFELFGGIP